MISQSLQRLGLDSINGFRRQGNAGPMGTEFSVSLKRSTAVSMERRLRNFEERINLVPVRL